MAEPVVGGLVEVAISVYDEAEALAHSIDLLCTYLRQNLPVRWRVVIVDNASTDATPRIAAELTQRHAEVEMLQFRRKGRGLALREAWTRSDAQVLAYMDVDLSTTSRASFRSYPRCSPATATWPWAAGWRRGHTCNASSSVRCCLGVTTL